MNNTDKHVQNFKQEHEYNQISNSSSPTNQKSQYDGILRSLVSEVDEQRRMFDKKWHSLINHLLKKQDESEQLIRKLKNKIQQLENQQLPGQNNFNQKEVQQQRRSLPVDQNHGYCSPQISPKINPNINKNDEDDFGTFDQLQLNIQKTQMSEGRTKRVNSLGNQLQLGNTNGNGGRQVSDRYRNNLAIQAAQTLKVQPRNLLLIARRSSIQHRAAYGSKNSLTQADHEFIVALKTQLERAKQIITKDQTHKKQLVAKIREMKKVQQDSQFDYVNRQSSTVVIEDQIEKQQKPSYSNKKIQTEINDDNQNELEMCQRQITKQDAFTSPEILPDQANSYFSAYPPTKILHDEFEEGRLRENIQFWKEKVDILLKEKRETLHSQMANHTRMRAIEYQLEDLRHQLKVKDDLIECYQIEKQLVYSRNNSLTGDQIMNKFAELQKLQKIKEESKLENQSQKSSLTSERQSQQQQHPYNTYASNGIENNIKEFCESSIITNEIQNPIKYDTYNSTTSIQASPSKSLFINNPSTQLVPSALSNNNFELSQLERQAQSAYALLNNPIFKSNSGNYNMDSITDPLLQSPILEEKNSQDEQLSNFKQNYSKSFVTISASTGRSPTPLIYHQNQAPSSFPSNSVSQKQQSTQNSNRKQTITNSTASFEQSNKARALATTQINRSVIKESSFGEDSIKQVSRQQNYSKNSSKSFIGINSYNKVSRNQSISQNNITNQSQDTSQQHQGSRIRLDSSFSQKLLPSSRSQMLVRDQTQLGNNLNNRYEPSELNKQKQYNQMQSVQKLSQNKNINHSHSNSHQVSQANINQTREQNKMLKGPHLSNGIAAKAQKKSIVEMLGKLQQQDTDNNYNLLSQQDILRDLENCSNLTPAEKILRAFRPTHNSNSNSTTIIAGLNTTVSVSNPASNLKSRYKSTKNFTNVNSKGSSGNISTIIDLDKSPLTGGMAARVAGYQRHHNKAQSLKKGFKSQSYSSVQKNSSSSKILQQNGSNSKLDTRKANVSMKTKNLTPQKDQYQEFQLMENDSNCLPEEQQKYGIKE